MLLIASILAGIAALIHVYIWVLESMLWQSARARRIFGTTPDEARTTAPLALNQGFYNLFLAITVLAGLALVASDALAAGLTALLIGTASMTGAGLVLIASDHTKARAAAVQAVVPLLAVVLLVVLLIRDGVG